MKALGIITAIIASVCLVTCLITENVIWGIAAIFNWITATSIAGGNND